MAEIPADPIRFEEAISAFKKRVPMSEKSWNKLKESQREYAFKVAEVTRADLVSEIYESISKAVVEGTDFGEFKDDIKEKIEKHWGGPKAFRLETIFRTNLSSAYNAGRHAVFTAPAVKEARPFLRFDAIDDSRISDICEELDGVIRPQDDPFWNTHTPPCHFNCFLPGTLVSGAWLGGLRGFYSGKAIELITAGNRRLMITPDHPVLTASGFVPAKAIRKGAYVLADSRDVYPGGTTTPLRENEKNEPAEAGKVFDLLRKTEQSAIRRPRELNLYGDPWRCDGDVDVVGTYASLLGHQKTHRPQAGGDLIFPATASQSKALNSHRPPSLLAQRSLRPPSSRLHALQSPGVDVRGDALRGGNIGLALRAQAHARVHEAYSHSVVVNAGFRSQRVDGFAAGISASENRNSGDLKPRPRAGFGATARVYPAATQSQTELTRRDARLGRQRLGRLSALVAPEQIVQSGNFLPARSRRSFAGRPQRHPMSQKSSSKRSVANADLAGQLLGGSAGNITLDEVVEVREFDFSGHVFDFETTTGWISSGNIVTSNCRSTVVALSADEADDEGITTKAPDTDADDGFGDPPSEDGTDWEPDTSVYSGDVQDELNRRLR